MRGIGFVSAGEATFSGTASSGVLTVSDVTHAAKIHLAGDYGGAPAAFALAVASFGASQPAQAAVEAVAAQPPPAALARPAAGF